MQMKYKFKTKQEILRASYHPSHTNFLCVRLLERAFFDYLECSHTIWYAYNELSIRARTKVVRRKHTIQPTGFGAYSSTNF